jgi:hypothetical protein
MNNSIRIASEDIEQLRACLRLLGCVISGANGIDGWFFRDEPIGIYHDKHLNEWYTVIHTEL